MREVPGLPVGNKTLCPAQKQKYLKFWWALFGERAWHVGDSLIEIPRKPIALNISAKVAKERRGCRRSPVSVSRQDRTDVDCTCRCRPGAHTGASKKLNSAGVASSPTAFGDAQMAKMSPLFSLSASQLPDQLITPICAAVYQHRHLFLIRAPSSRRNRS
jgi:hypothetical protein